MYKQFGSQEEYNEFIEKMNSQHESAIHEQYAWIKTLDPDGSLYMFRMLSNTTSKNKYQVFLSGVVFSVFYYDHDGCGCDIMRPFHTRTSHLTDELTAEMKPEAPVVEEPKPSESDATHWIADTSNPNPAHPDTQALMQQYHMGWDQDTGWFCRRCGLNYTSLQDRMVKSPDDCHGCHRSAANGGVVPWND